MDFFMVYIYQISPELRKIPIPQIIIGTETSKPVSCLAPVSVPTKGLNRKAFAAITMFA